MMPNIPVVRAQIIAGKLRALAVNASARSPLLPDVPTLAEAGYGGMELSEWFGVLAPAGTEPKIVETLHAALARALRKPAVLARLEELGLSSEPTTPGELAARIAAELVTYSNAVRELGIQSDG
jgi:tripartite-type tricarboxylate transporter receptor subunit TctC